MQSLSYTNMPAAMAYRGKPRNIEKVVKMAQVVRPTA